MKTKVYNLQGKEVGELALSDKVFGVKVKSEVVHQVFVQQTNKQREPWADTQSKGEVRGGGKKPWQQKGTGRARHGSIRMCLSDKVASNHLIVVDELAFPEPKTKLFVAAKKLLPAHRSLLILTAGKNENILRMTKNLQDLMTARAEDTNVMDLMNRQTVLTDKAGIKKLEETFGK